MKGAFRPQGSTLQEERTRFCHFRSQLPSLPAIPKPEGKPNSQGRAALCWSSGVRAAEAEGCKISIEKRNFFLSSAIGALVFLPFSPLVRHLAEQSLTTCGTHRLTSAECPYHSLVQSAQATGPSRPVCRKQEREGASYLSFVKTHLFMTSVQ